ncbi:uncharacterized protein JCM15063_003566 [Sporobolomyces koalae]|uniref:uncharacterized protein n=1 Tax=Sporobolomyces koalae TaxID=500713 RepID=UPI00317199CE
MINAPPSVHLPSGSVLVEDADEEIFLLYTNKQQRATSESAATGRGAAELGYHSDQGDVLAVNLSVNNPWSGSGQADTVMKSRKFKKGKGKEKETLEVNVELRQSLAALRNRKGDTGSVLWRLSLHLAEYILTLHHFPSPEVPCLLPNLSTSSILELGSGTGFLGLALRSIFAPFTPSTHPTESAFKWTFSDQLDNLPLILRNLRGNSISESEIGDSPAHPYSIVELDWLAESRDYLADRTQPRKSRQPGSFPDLILAVDCIYNPALASPLAHTILRNSGSETVVVVASELRDSEALETFLRCWLEEGRQGGWQVTRLGWESLDEQRAAGDLADPKFVVWVGWRQLPGE